MTTDTKIITSEKLSIYGNIISAENDGSFMFANSDFTPKDFSKYENLGLTVSFDRKKNETDEWMWEKYEPQLIDGKYIRIDMEKGDKIATKSLWVFTTKRGKTYEPK